VSVAFLITSLAIVATQGTGAILTIAAGLRHGRRMSVLTAFGCTLGTLPHLAAAVTGTAALLRASGVAFDALKVAGVCYLLYLAVRTWRDKGLLTVDGTAAAPSAARTIVSAVTANLLNPKLTLFFFAFLPQFLDSRHGTPVAQMLGLGAVFVAMTFVVFTGYGLFASAVRDHVISKPRVVRRIQRTFSLSYVALGAKLAVTQR
jgi:threonine/homoserine/homoserine lactone efflux protein